MKKVCIELTPYEALAILAFLREFINDENRHEKQLTAIHRCVDRMEEEVCKMPLEDINEAIHESRVYSLIGLEPPFKS